MQKIKPAIQFCVAGFVIAAKAANFIKTTYFELSKFYHCFFIKILRYMGGYILKPKTDRMQLFFAGLLQKRSVVFPSYTSYKRYNLKQCFSFQLVELIVYSPTNIFL